MQAWSLQKSLDEESKGMSMHWFLGWWRCITTSTGAQSMQACGRHGSSEEESGRMCGCKRSFYGSRGLPLLSGKQSGFLWNTRLSQKEDHYGCFRGVKLYGQKVKHVWAVRATHLRAPCIKQLVVQL